MEAYKETMKENSGGNGRSEQAAFSSSHEALGPSRPVDTLTPYPLVSLDISNSYRPEIREAS